MREIMACLNAIGNSLVENGNVLVQEREENCVYYSILQKARETGSSISEQGLPSLGALMHSPCLVTQGKGEVGTGQMVADE